MPCHQQARVRARTRTGTSTWLALAAALGLHAIILVLPIARQVSTTENVPAQIELQLITLSRQSPAPKVPESQDNERNIPEPGFITPESAVEEEESIAKAETTTAQRPPVATIAAQDVEINNRDEMELRRKTPSILSAQYITWESEADKLFGKPLELQDTPRYSDFSRPLGQDMISMLDQPVPNLPFAYTPGLVRFAYEPGVKGDLQRFWDLITPEFGWRTDNGTEFRCVLVLVIVGCGWK